MGGDRFDAGSKSAPLVQAPLPQSAQGPFKRSVCCSECAAHARLLCGPEEPRKACAFRLLLESAHCVQL